MTGAKLPVPISVENVFEQTVALAEQHLFEHRFGKLTPLADPAPNAPKWFAAVEIIRLAADQDWLHKSTREISKYWRSKRSRRLNPQPIFAVTT
jgi:hypothetical protein